MNRQIERLISDLVHKHSDDDVIVFVTTAIRLRLIGGSLRLPCPRMATGHFAIVEIKNGHWKVNGWDMDPLMSKEALEEFSAIFHRATQGLALAAYDPELEGGV